MAGTLALARSGGGCEHDTSKISLPFRSCWLLPSSCCSCTGSSCRFGFAMSNHSDPDGCDVILLKPFMLSMSPSGMQAISWRCSDCETSAASMNAGPVGTSSTGTNSRSDSLIGTCRCFCVLSIFLHVSGRKSPWPSCSCGGRDEVPRTRPTNETW